MDQPPTSWTRSRLWAVLALTALGWLALGWPWLGGAVTIPWDAKAHFYPQLQFLAQSLRTGQSPFWAPQIFGGHPQIADPQSLIFSPPFFLLAFFNSDPSFRAADATILGMLLLGALSLVMLFRDREWHPAGAVVCALSFAFGAASAWRLQHIGQILSLSWFAITLFLLSRALERRSAGYGLAAGLTAGCMVLGRDQVALLGVYVLAGLVIAAWLTSGQPWKAIRATMKPLLAGLVGGLLVVTIPLLLTLMLAEQSNRPVIDLEGAYKGSLHPFALLTGFIANLFGAAGPLAQHWGPPSPAWDAAFGGTNLYLARNMSQLYLGLIPMLLVVSLGLVRGRMWSREIMAVSIAMLALLVFALGRYTPGFQVMFAALPGVDLYRRPADAMFLLGALLAILGGYLTHRLMSDEILPHKTWQIAGDVAAGTAIILSALWLADYVGAFRLVIRPMVISALCLSLSLGALIAARGIARRGGVLVPALILGATLMVDLATNNGPHESTAMPPSSYAMLRPDSSAQTIAELKRHLSRTAAPDRRDRVELAGIDFAWPNVSLIQGFDNTLGYNPVRLALYSRATGAGDHVALPDQRNFSPLFPSYRSLLADMLGLRFIATGVPVEQMDKALKPGDLKLLVQTNESYIYENPRALPRVMLATEAVTADFGQILKTGAWPVFDPAKTVLLEKLALVPTPATPPAMALLPAARLVSYANTEVVAEAVAPRGGWLVLNDVWQPWWTVEVNGQPAELLQANVLFRAVRVPAGRSTVRFVFKPLQGLAGDIEARVKTLLN